MLALGALASEPASVWVGADERALNSVRLNSCNFGGVLIYADPTFRPSVELPALTYLLPRSGGHRLRTKVLKVRIFGVEGRALAAGTLFLDHAMLDLPSEAWRLLSTCVIEDVPIDRLRARIAELSRVDRAILLGLIFQTADLRGHEIDLSLTTIEAFTECKNHGKCEDLISEAIVPAFGGSP
jgi:hypothetical protein